MHQHVLAGDWNPAVRDAARQRALLVHLDEHLPAAGQRGCGRGEVGMLARDFDWGCGCLCRQRDRERAVRLRYDWTMAAAGGSLQVDGCACDWKIIRRAHDQAATEDCEALVRSVVRRFTGILGRHVGRRWGVGITQQLAVADVSTTARGDGVCRKRIVRRAVGPRWVFGAGRGRDRWVLSLGIDRSTCEPNPHADCAYEQRCANSDGHAHAKDRVRRTCRASRA